MNKNEQAIFNLVKENPYITQLELAERIGLSRPAVANIISGLMRQRYILGKAYVINEESPIVCIGAANVDRKFYIDTPLQPKTSNPVSSSRSIGGVSRNIAENLGRLGEKVTFLTASGNDSEWDMINRMSSPFMDLSAIQPIENASTGSYTAVIKDGDMEYGFADMEIYEQITPDFLARYAQILTKAKCLVADLNLPKSALEFLSAFAQKNHIKFVIVPVSSPKMVRMPQSLHAVDWLIINRDESETYLNMSIRNISDMQRAAEKWVELGVSNVIITNGLEPLIFKNCHTEHIVPISPAQHFVDATGAGDSFTSAVIYSWLNDFSLQDIIKSGMVNSLKTVETNYTVRQNLDNEQLKRDMEEYNYEAIS